LSSPSLRDQIKLYGGTGKNLPTLIIVDPFRKSTFPFDESSWSQKLDASRFEGWIDLFFLGRLTPKIKSGVIPKHNHQHIKEIVGTNFKEIVQDTSRDVAVLFYDPWCDRCQSFLPIYEAVAEALCDVSTVTVAKMDASSNDPPPGVVIGSIGLPTVLMFPATRKNNPIEFIGLKNAQSLMEFVHSHASIYFDLPSVDVVALELKKRQEHHEEKSSKRELERYTVKVPSIFSSKKDILS
jgi:thiol-disulfide isomerase/thioredoxin